MLTARRTTPYYLMVALLMLAGCHSAFFQTAKIEDGVDLSAGVTRVSAADNPGISDYSILIRGQIGRQAHRDRFGYGLALSVISPFKNKYRDLLVRQDIDQGTFPNEFAGIMPELKIQMPRRLPIDLALDTRFMGVYPERLALLASRDVAGHLTLYGGFSYNAAVGRLLGLGAEVNLTRRWSLLIERTQWLSEHRYPEAYRGPIRKEPYAFGLALSHHMPRRAERFDPGRYAATSYSIRP